MLTNFCNIVLPIYNSLTYVKDCIESIIEHTSPDHFNLYIIDDSSDTVTYRFLQEHALTHPQITLHRNTINLGFVKSCNIGISIGKAPYVVLINSDVIVTPRWLEKLIACAESDSKIASVNPLTNYASQIKLPMAPGANFYGMNWYLEGNSPRHFPDVVTGVGFCLLLRRAALADVGVFDEIYGRGYCEEADLCMRLTTQGYRTVVADHVYVYHKGQASFTDRDERYLHNRQIFDRRWAREYRRQFSAFRTIDPLRPTRELFTLHRRWDPMPMVWETARGMLRHWRNKDIISAARTAIHGLLQLPKAQREVPTPDSVAKVTRPGRLRVTYVLHNLVVAGGVLSVIQLVNELIRLGVEARIVALYEDPAIYKWTKLFTRPIVFRNPEELITRFPETDIAVATLWNTASWVSELVNQGRAQTSAYFIQDYEPWFFSEEDKAAREQVKASYRLIENKIVKSDWLQDRLAKEGFKAAKISLGMDLAQFYPRDVQSSNPTILAMARPGTPRRGFASTINALAQVKQVMPDTEIVLFGDRFLSSQNIPFPYRDEGVVTDQNRLAELYSEATVFLDGSDFQGFGRCALEAMACGAACVLTGVGGVTEYAKNGSNAIIVSPKQPTLFAEAIINILKDPQLKKRLVKEGFSTADQYCYKREARKTLEYFRTIHITNFKKEFRCLLR